MVTITVGARAGELHQRLHPDVPVHLERDRLVRPVPLRRRARSWGCGSPRTPSTPLADGTHTFSVKAIDVAGNQSTVSPAPSPSTRCRRRRRSPRARPTAARPPDHTPTFGFVSSQAGSTFQCRFDAELFAACSGPGDTHTPATDLTTGTHSFEVRATDKASHVDPTARQAHVHRRPLRRAGSRAGPFSLPPRLPGWLAESPTQTPPTGRAPRDRPAEQPLEPGDLGR